MKTNKTLNLNELTKHFDHLLIQLISRDLKQLRFQQFKTQVLLGEDLDTGSAGFQKN